MEEIGIANSITYIDDDEGQMYISSLEEVPEADKGNGGVVWHQQKSIWTLYWNSYRIWMK